MQSYRPHITSSGDIWPRCLHHASTCGFKAATWICTGLFPRVTWTCRSGFPRVFPRVYLQVPTGSPDLRLSTSHLWVLHVIYCGPNSRLNSAPNERKIVQNGSELTELHSCKVSGCYLYPMWQGAPFFLETRTQVKTRLFSDSLAPNVASF